MIYRPVCSGTVEERIQAMQARKKGLADALWDGSGQAGGELTEADLQALLAPLPG
jgi:SNF2 family DNA or RNA helicase